MSRPFDNVLVPAVRALLRAEREEGTTGRNSGSGHSNSSQGEHIATKVTNRGKIEPQIGCFITGVLRRICITMIQQSNSVTLMSHGKQFTLFSHVTDPNGWKVAFVLNILGLTYETHQLELAEIKETEHTRYNPNRCIPTLIDHNNNNSFVVWESNAISMYLIEKYDADHKLSLDTLEDNAIINQWLFFQASGQGPYFGQAVWFRNLHHERVPSAIERYQNETRRILGVLEAVLGKQEWLVGGKFTFADLSFMSWNVILDRCLGSEFDFGKEFLHTYAWHSKMVAMDGVKMALAERAALVAELQVKSKAQLGRKSHECIHDE